MKIKNNPSLIDIPHNIKPFVDRIELFESGSPNDLIHQMLPIGAIQLIIQYGDSIRHQTNFTKGWETRPTIFIGGPFNYMYELATNPNNSILAIQFSPTQMRHFIDFPAYELQNSLLTPTEIWGSRGLHLESLLTQNNDPHNAINAVSKFLNQSYIQRKKSAIQIGIRYLHQKKGLCKIDQLASLVNLSVSRFRQLFLNEIGLAPKLYSKLVRINSLIEDYQKNQFKTLTELAYHYEYFDQAHFVKDFKIVTGLTPSQYLKE